MRVQVLHDPVDVTVLDEHVGEGRILIVVEPQVFECGVVLATDRVDVRARPATRDSVRSR